MERHSHAHAHFLTLTYNETSVPQKLDYEDISAFLKRFRKNTGAFVRFFCVGEYGKRTRRPHWHMILYCDRPLFPKGLCFIPEWPHGGVYCGDVTRHSMEYVGRYSMKNHREKEEYVVRCSLRPGLGYQRLWEYGAALARAQPVLHCEPYYMTIDGRYYPLDRTARRYILEGFAAAGGALEREEVLRYRYDVVAPFERFVGDPAAANYSFAASVSEDAHATATEAF